MSGKKFFGRGAPGELSTAGDDPSRQDAATKTRMLRVFASREELVLSLAKLIFATMAKIDGQLAEEPPVQTMSPWNRWT